MKNNKKIEFEFSCPQKIEMLDEPRLSYENYLEGDGEDYEENECQKAIEKLLKDNSLEIETDKIGNNANTDEKDKKVITFQANKKYYLTLNDIKLLKKMFNIPPHKFRFLTPSCIYKNVFILPLNILISFLDDTVCLNYQEYYFKEKQENNNQSKEIDDILSETLNDIKYSEQVNLDNAVKKINCIMTDYGFEEIKTKSELADTCKNIVNKNDTQEDINSILEKIKNALNQAILSEALNILTSNLALRPIGTKLMNVVETFLFSDLEDASDDLKKILGGKIVKLDKREELVNDGQDEWILKTIEKEDSIKGLIKNSDDVDSVLKSLKSLKETRISICKACDFLISCSYEDEILGDQENTKNAIEEIANKKSSSLSNEYVIAILNQLQKIAELDGDTTDNETQDKQLLLDHINCIIKMVQKYKLDVEDENPLKNVIRMFLDKKNNIQRDVICSKINEMLKEQIYTAMLEKRPSLLLFVDFGFLYKKIILDEKENVFKTTFYNIETIVKRKRFNIYQYLNSFLNCLLQDETLDVEKYCYDFTAFILNSINGRKNPFESESLPCTFACMLISKLSSNFIYKRIFPKDKNISKKNPIRNLLDRLFKNGQPSVYAKQWFYGLSDEQANIISNTCSDKIKIRQEYYKKYPLYWVIVAHVLSNLEYKPEYKDNFLYFFDLFDWTGESAEDNIHGNCNAWLGLFDFVHPSFLYGNLDVIERYLTFCKGYPDSYVKLADTKIEKICDYDNYSQYATESKLSEKDYFYMLLRYNKKCIKHMEAGVIFDHLKDEEMKYYYQWIRDNAESQVQNMYKYVIDKKKYDSTEKQDEDVFLLIDIFPDAMKIYIDSEFVMNNWDNPKMNSFRDNYYKNDDNLLIDCRVKINMYRDRKLRTEKTLQFIKTFGAEKAGEHIDKEFLLRNLNDKDIGDTVQECIELCAKADGRFCKSLYNVAIDGMFYKDVFGEDRQVQKKKIILDLINICKEKIFEYVDNQFLLENSDNEMIKNMFAYADKSEITSILEYMGKSNEDNKKKMSNCLTLIELIKNNPKIDKKTICEYINNDILLANLDNEIIKDLITHASDEKINSILRHVNTLNCDEESEVNMYVKLIQCGPKVLLDCIRSINQNSSVSSPQASKAVNQIILSKDIRVLSLLNDWQENEQCINNFFYYVKNMQPSNEKTQIINAVSCLDSPSLKEQLTDKYMFRNLACIKYNLDDNDSFGGLPLERRALAFNLFKIHNQQNCDLNLTDLVAANHRLCCEIIDFHFPEYKNLAKIIRLSYKKYLWFIWIVFSIFVIALVCSVLFKVLLVAVMSTILIYYLIFECFVLDSITFKKIFSPLSLKKYETDIKHEKEARHGFYSFLKNKFDFKTHIDIYNKTLESVNNKNIDIKKDFFEWLKANKKDEPFNKENDRNKKIDFVVDFILRAPNNEVIKKLDGEIKKLGDFSNDNNARNLINNWLNRNQNYNNCREVLQSEFLDIIKFKSGELKIKLKRKDNIKTLAEKIYDQIIDPQDKNLDLQDKKENEKEEEINTSTKDIIINNNQSESDNSMPPIKSQSEKQI